MAKPTNKEELKTWMLMELGHPVAEVNVDDEQIENCIVKAFAYFQDFHHDAVERVYLKHQVTQEDKDNQFIPVSDDVIGINRVFPFASSVSVNMFDLRYQMRLHELYDFTSSSYVNYTMTQQHIRTIDMLFSGETPVRFNRHTNKLFIDWDWQNKVAVGEYLIIESWVIVDPETYNDIWSDRLFKELATAYLKKQWGMNMKKFQGMQLPGGIVMNGQVTYDEAVEEIDKLEALIRSSHEAPPMFLIG